MKIIDFNNNAPPGISEETLEEIQKNAQEAILEKDVLTAYQTAAQIANQNQTCKLQSSVQIGSNLSLSNNAIVIGERIKSIKVKGQIFFEYIPTDQNYFFIRIKKNDTVIASKLTKYSGGDWWVADVEFSPVGVSEGDLITLNFGDISSKQPTTRPGKQETFLTVEVLEYTD